MPPSVCNEPGEAVAVTELSLAQLADEYTLVRSLMMAWRPAVNPHQERFAALQGELLARHENTPAGQKILVIGEHYIVPISPREQKTTITDALAVYKLIRRQGIEAVVKAYSITLANVRKLLSAANQAKYLKTERTGGRTIGEPVLKEARG